ncbi:hypothetical protein BGZ65_008070, partial [Modicella reniformis]
MEEDDDFEPPSTPRSIRFRPAIPVKTLRSKQSTEASSSQKALTTQRVTSMTQSMKRKHADQDTHKELPRQKSTPFMPLPVKAGSKDSSGDHTAIRPRTNFPRSLKKPTLRRPISDQTARSSQKTLSEIPIVLDSEPEDHLDENTAQPFVRPPTLSPIKRPSTMASLPSPPRPFSLVNRYTQESIANSQGSEDEYHQDMNNDEQLSDNYHNDGTGGYASRYWSLSPDTTNPFLSDLVAAKSSSSVMESTTAALPETNSITLETTPSQEQPKTPVLNAAKATTNTITMQTDEDTFAGTFETQKTAYDHEVLQNDEAIECLICGKRLAHLDPGRIEYHINGCIDQQQREQQALESLDMDSALPLQASSSQGQFAGAQVDYLTRVKKCPICKQDWPLKGKGKAGTSAQPRKAKHKVEHMKRCARAHNRTAQSLVYQIRIMKEIDDSMTPIEGGELEDEGEDSREKVKVTELRKPSPNTAVVVSLTDTADTDFASDAIITTIRAPAPSRPPPRLDKLQKMEEDQQDEDLQLALAISMSVQSSDTDPGAGWEPSANP